MTEEIQNEEIEVRNYQVGDVVEGEVTKVEDKHALIDFGYKNEGILPIGEISNVHIDKVSDAISVGDKLTTKVTKVNDEDEIILSKRAVDNEQAWDDIEQKLQSQEVFEVNVAEIVKGGLVVDIGLRGFIPASLVERHFVEDFAEYQDRTLRVKVIEMDREKNKVILSQKAVLDEEVEKQKQDRINQIEVGSIIDGTVQRLTSFGAFVDIGGIDGLVHISELAWNRVESPSEVVSEGDQVKVKVLKVDPDNEKVSLSIKATEEGPWDKVANEVKAGDVVQGVVRRLVSFGAFVEIAPGVEGLVHISQISNQRIGTPNEVLKEGQEVNAKVLEINLSEQRISLSIKELLEDNDQKYVKEYQEKENQSSGMGVTLGDMIGDQLRKLK